jgi:hypothetical protein
MYSPPWFLSLLRKERETTSHSAYFAPSLILREGDGGEYIWFYGRDMVDRFVKYK